MHNLRLLVVVAILTSSIAVNRYAYDICDQRWMLQFYPSFERCEKQGSDNSNSNAVVLLSNYLTWNEIPCLGISPCTPGILIKHPHLKQPAQFLKDLALRIDEEINIPQVKREIKNGKTVFLVTTGNKLYLAYDANQEVFIAVSPRAERFEISDLVFKTAGIITHITKNEGQTS
eukprot:TRINITY_DN7162_c0_g1_i20.p1 TRINITY_DN7162_c0_g1~~TRINITY_DN7162_c0_g1_i20.p1  ORF type:complete len:174 (+),score=14.50 TRINITY_DN7162_c0_g1_i20:146-667(+)